MTLGLAVSVGGIAAPLIGALAERTSLVTALSYLLTLPALSWAIARRLHEPTNAATVADNSGPQVAMPAGPA